MLLLCEQHEDAVKYDVTIEASAEQASGLSGHIIELCTKHGIDARTANKVGVAIEEMAVSTAHYAHKADSKGMIDVTLRITDETLTVQVRDNGATFNPLEYTADENDGCITDGIQLIKQLASMIDYARRLGSNTTIISFDLKPQKS